MYVLDLLQSVLREGARIIRSGAEIQQEQRDELRNKFSKICNSCLDAFATVKKRLLPIKQNYQDPQKLVDELREFSADSDTRGAFKPQQLCRQVDELLMNLESNLHGLKYSISVSKIHVLRKALGDVGYLDQEMYRQYEDFASQLDELANQIEASNGQDQQLLVDYIKTMISEFEEDLKSAITTIHKDKDGVLR
jgi:hypothetical protein